MGRLTRESRPGTGSGPSCDTKDGAGGASARRAFMAAAALSSIVFVSGCAKEKESFRCYDYQNGSLKVYVENGNANPRELGTETSVGRAELAVAGEPLAYFCTNSGHILYVSEDTVYIRKLSPRGGGFGVERILEYRHTAPDEYGVPGVQVVSADIWRNPDAPYERLTVATLTNTGIVQASRYSLEGVASNDPDHGLFDLTRKLRDDLRWPRGVSSATVHVLDSEEIAVVPIGERGKGSSRIFYHIAFAGDGSKPLYSRMMDIQTMKVFDNFPDLRNIFEVSEGVRFDRSLGGWIINLRGERADGSTFPIFAILTPR